MRNFYDRLIILFFIFSISSCANQIIPYLSIEDVKVEESFIKVYLSGNPNQNKCIEAFAFYKDDIQITGKFSFSEKAFLVYIESHSVFPLNLISNLFIWLSK